MKAMDVVFEQLGTHLWQSTLFVGMCLVATLLLKHNRASIRHAIWVTASLKFLFPLSVLVAAGTYAGELTDLRVVPDIWAGTSGVVQPFAAGETTGLPLAPRQTTRKAEAVFNSRVLFYGWLSGSVGVALWGIVCRRRLSALMGKAALLREGREVEALRRVRSRYGFSDRLRLASSVSSIEPGVRGILRPVLFLPAGIADRLDDDELETIILHELCHVRRWDNLSASLHGIVQTLFWFHPLVWWLGTRLVDERERACDESVLRLGGDAPVYASAILRVCEFYVAAPSSAVSRVTGSNLKRRIEDIMRPRPIIEMSSARKLSLACAVAVFMAAPVLFGLSTASRSASQSAPPRIAPTVMTTAAPAPVAQARPPAAPRVIPAPNPPTPVSRPQYVIRPGDELEISVWREPEVSRRIIVRPDGNIGIPLLGDVPAEGLTPAGLKDEIQGELRRFLTDPQVTVIVGNVRKPQVTIQGSVVRPGAYVLEGRPTLLQLIAQAGGLTAFAKRERISVFREEGGRVQPYYFDYNRFLEGLDLDQNIVLKEDDIVIVP